MYMYLYKYIPPQVYVRVMHKEWDGGKEKETELIDVKMKWAKEKRQMHEM